MSEHLDAPTRTDRPRLSARNRAGLGLAAFLGVTDLLWLVGITEPAPGEVGPPSVVLIGAAILGVVTLVAAVPAWRTGSRIAARIVAGSRILSLISALPAFFVAGLPGLLVASVAVFAVLTVVAVGLVLSRPANAPTGG